jgi:hypothetical protein
LEGDDGESKLGGDISKERADYSGNIRFLPDWICPHIMGKSIYEHNIILETRMTVNRGGPNIGVYNLEGKECKVKLNFEVVSEHVCPHGSDGSSGELIYNSDNPNYEGASARQGNLGAQGDCATARSTPETTPREPEDETAAEGRGLLEHHIGASPFEWTDP